VKRLAELSGDLAQAPHANARMRQLSDYFENASDDLGWSVAWLTNALSPPRQSPTKLRKMAEERVDPELFRLSAAAIGDIGETVALIWPGAGDLPVQVVAAGDAKLADLLDQLDAVARVALIRLIAGRKVKGVKATEVHQALAARFDVDAGLIAGALIQENPPYPNLFEWLTNEGPAPNWAPPRPPSLPRLPKSPRPPFSAWKLPEGVSVSVENGRAFSDDGVELKLKVGAPDGWGFFHDGEVFNVTATPPLDDPLESHDQGQALLIRSGDTDDWSIWPAASRTIICPVTFIEIGRAVNVTLGIAVSGEVAPLIKLEAPEATKVSAFARKAVIDKFGPVRQVGPGLWAELSYEAISPAPRRKIGVALKGAEINHLIWKDGPAMPDLSEIT
jgi:hypothetical protein